MLDIYGAKRSAKQTLAQAGKRPRLVAGLYAVVLNGLLLLLQYAIQPLEEGLTYETLYNQLIAGDYHAILRMVGFDLLSLLFSFIFAAGMASYAVVQTSGGKNRLGASYILRAAGAALLLFLLFLVSTAALSLCMLLRLPGLLLMAVVLVCLVFLFYALRLSFYAVAESAPLSPIKALGQCYRSSRGHRKEIFFLDFSFLWFTLLTGAISYFFAALPDTLLILAQSGGFTVAAGLLEANSALLSVVCSVLSLLAVGAMYYGCFAYIQFTYAFAYRQLLHLQPKRNAKYPLAYEEGDPEAD